MALAHLLLRTPASVPHAEAQAHAAAGGVVVYWRPGCPFCQRLRLVVRRFADRARWVNIWEDADGAAYVRSVAGGDETVPTVVLGGEAVVNPSPWRVRRALAR